MFWIYFRVLTPKNWISATHYLAMNLFWLVYESPTMETFILIAVFEPHTKKVLSCDTDIDATAATADTAFIWGAATLCASGHFPIVPSSRSFCQVFNFWYGRVTTLMSISAALVSLFLPFMHIHMSYSRIGGTSHLTSLPFFSTHYFKIMCNSHENFPHHRRLVQGLKGEWKQLSHMLLFS